MKKMKNLCMLFLALTFTFVIGFSSVQAVPNQVTVKRAVTVKDLISREDKGLTIFETTDGNSIYCMDIEKKALITGQTATLSGDGDAGLLYILHNGYPYKSFVKNVEIDKYITQIAVWWYLSEDKLSDDFKNATDIDKHNLRPIIKDLVAKARKAKDTQPKPSMTVDGKSGSMTLTSDGKYFESSYMSAKVIGANTYNVTLSGAPSNTVVVNESGNIGTTLNSGEKFKVRVPASEVSTLINIKIKFTSIAKTTKAKVYKPSDSAYQRVIGLYDESISLTKEIVLTAKQAKVCEYTGGKYYDRDGKETDKATYEKQCKHICEFTDNKYYGKNGDEVDKTTFNKECNASCEYIDGEYHGKDGSVVDKTTFEKECNKTCEVVNDKYYGKNGNEVDKETYNKECGQEVVVPNTEANIIIWIVILGVLSIAAGTALLINRSDKRLIKKR